MSTKHERQTHNNYVSDSYCITDIKVPVKRKAPTKLIRKAPIKKQEEKPVTAIVEWIIGDKLMCKVARNAGLGLTGIGFPQRTEITYKAGEKVDEFRVMNTLKLMMEEFNKSDSKLEIHCPKVISISPNE